MYNQFKTTARLSLEASMTPTLRKCAANAITAMHAASTNFAMHAMLGRLAAQFKMPRPARTARPQRRRSN